MLVTLPKFRPFWKLLPRRSSPAPLAVSHGLPALEAFRRNHRSFSGALFDKRPHGTWLSQAKTFNCAFCIAADQDLISKKCVPCNSKDIRSMSEQSAQELLPQVEGWVMVNDNGVLKLHRSWKVKSFTKGMEFLQHVADVAEAEGHHPDLHLVGWNNVKIDIWTHAVGGLTENDFILAAKIGSLDLKQLLRRKAGEAGATM